jgi:hypothetical protein
MNLKGWEIYGYAMLRNVYRMCKRYKVDFDKLLKEVKRKEG